MSKEIDVLMNNAIDEMTKEQQLEYYKEYYNLSRQQVADETHLESSRLRDEIIKDLNEYDTYKVLGYKSHYSETDRHFYVMSDNDKACGFGIVDGKLFLSHLIPLPLASKIIKYFELESEYRMSITREEIKQIIEDNTEFGYTSYKQIADRINDLINQKERLQVQVARPTDIEEWYWYCPNCKEELCNENVTFQELHDTCGHPVKWVKPLTSTPIKDTVVEEALNLLDYIRVLMLNCKTTEKLIDYYYEPVKQHIQAQSKALQDKDNEIEVLKDRIAIYETLGLGDGNEAQENYKKAFEHMQQISQEHIDKLIAIEELCNEGWNGYNAVDLLDKLEQIIKEGNNEE